MSSSSGTKSDPNMSTSKVRAAAAVALSAAAVKAKLLADEELRKMQTLVSRIIENQVETHARTPFKCNL